MMQTATIQFQYYTECTVLQVGATPNNRSFRWGQGAPDRPYSLFFIQRQGKCKIIVIQCTPANYSCSASKNTMLAGSGIARWGGGAVPPHIPNNYTVKTIVQFSLFSGILFAFLYSSGFKDL